MLTKKLLKIIKCILCFGVCSDKIEKRKQINYKKNNTHLNNFLVKIIDI